MNRQLNPVIREIEKEYRNLIQADGRNYIEVSIAGRAQRMGISGLDPRCVSACAIVPIKHPVEGMKVRIDGRTFVNYVQFSSGVVVPDYIGQHTCIAHKPYIPQNSMICNFN